MHKSCLAQYNLIVETFLVAQHVATVNSTIWSDRLVQGSQLCEAINSGRTFNNYVNYAIIALVKSIRYVYAVSNTIPCIYIVHNRFGILPGLCIFKCWNCVGHCYCFCLLDCMASALFIAWARCVVVIADLKRIAWGRRFALSWLKMLDLHAGSRGPNFRMIVISVWKTTWYQLGPHLRRHRLFHV